MMRNQRVRSAMIPITALDEQWKTEPRSFSILSRIDPDNIGWWFAREVPRGGLDSGAT